MTKLAPPWFQGSEDKAPPLVEACSKEKHAHFTLQRETNFKENEFYFIFMIQISKP